MPPFDLFMVTQMRALNIRSVSYSNFTKYLILRRHNFHKKLKVSYWKVVANKYSSILQSSSSRYSAKVAFW